MSESRVMWGQPNADGRPWFVESPNSFTPVYSCVINPPSVDDRHNAVCVRLDRIADLLERLVSFKTEQPRATRRRTDSMGPQ